MKKLFGAALALAAMTGIARADGVVLSDNDLDRVTAGVLVNIGGVIVDVPASVAAILGQLPVIVPVGNVKTATAPGVNGVASCVGPSCSVAANAAVTTGVRFLNLCSSSGAACGNNVPAT